MPGPSKLTRDLQTCFFPTKNIDTLAQRGGMWRVELSSSLIAKSSHNILAMRFSALLYSRITWDHRRAWIGQHLPTCPPPAILAPLNKAPVEIHSDGPLIHLGPAEVLDRVLGIPPCVVHHKAEPTGRLLLLVQPHDDALHIATPGEHLPQPNPLSARGAAISLRKWIYSYR